MRFPRIVRPHLPTTRGGWIALGIVSFVVAVLVSAGLSALINPRPYDPMEDGVKSAAEAVNIVDGSFTSSSGKDIGIQADIGCDFNQKRYLRATGFAYNSTYLVTVVGDLRDATNDVRGYTYTYSGQADKDGFMYLEIDCTLPAGWYIYRLDSKQSPSWMQFQFRVYPLRK